MEVYKYNLREMRKALDSKSISVKELAGIYLERAKSANKEIGGYVSFTEDVLFAQAEKAQTLINKGESSPLTGIPTALKDSICTDGIVTSCGSKMLEDFKPPYNATVVDKLEKNGCCLIGKAAMDEFAMGGSSQTSPLMKTKNPRDLDYVSGGSSGGSAAVVAAELAAYSIASDTGGGIRQASSFCGVTGLKPTYGSVSRFGLVAFASSLDQIGAIAKNARDCGIIMNSIAGYDKNDATSANINYPDYTAKIGKSIQGLRIALPKEFFGEDINPKVAEIAENAARKLEKMGAVIVKADMPSLKYAVPAYYIISSAEASSNLAKFDGINYGFAPDGNTYNERVLNSRNGGFGDEVKRRILLGNYALSSHCYDVYFQKALAIKQIIKKEYDNIFAAADLILTPSAPETAYKIGSQETAPMQRYLADICTVTANIAGLPAISTTADYIGNLPVGIQLIGKKFDEPTIIQAADAFEAGK